MCCVYGDASTAVRRMRIGSLQSVSAIVYPMCGLGALLACARCGGGLLADGGAALAPVLARRGPDAQGCVRRTLGGAGGEEDASVALHLHAAVLHLRGAACAPQPAVAVAAPGGGDALCWNGEVFGGLEVAARDSDTPAVLAALSAAAAASASSSGPGVAAAAAVARALSGIAGPYAFLFFHAAGPTASSSSSLLFGRDPVGRRSLVLALPAPGRPLAAVASAPFPLPGATASAAASLFRELPPLGVYELRHVTAAAATAAAEGAPSDAAGADRAADAPRLLSTSALCCGQALQLRLWPWPVAATLHRAGLALRPPAPLPRNDSDLPFFSDAHVGAAAVELLRRLSESVRLRVRGVAPRAAAAAAAPAALTAPEPLPLPRGDAAEWAAARSAPLAARGIYRAGTEPLASEALAAADAAGRAATLPANAVAHLASAFQCGDGASGSSGGVAGAGVAVLFSGGLDSMLLARLAHEHVPLAAPIDLVNVCFAAPAHASPDRLAAVAGLAELRALCPGRRWQLVCVDESYATAVAASPAVTALVAPRGSHMDWNIGAALWHASRAVGYVDVDVDVDGGAAMEDGAAAAADGSGSGAVPRASFALSSPEGRVTRHLRYSGGGGSSGAATARANGAHNLSVFDGRITAAAGAGGPDGAATPHDGPAGTVAPAAVAAALAASRDDGDNEAGLATQALARAQLEALPPAVAAAVAAYRTSWPLRSDADVSPAQRALLDSICYVPAEGEADEEGDDSGGGSGAAAVAPAAASVPPADAPPPPAAALGNAAAAAAAAAPRTKHKRCKGLLVDGEPCTAPGSRKCSRHMCAACCKAAVAAAAAAAAAGTGSTTSGSTLPPQSSCYFHGITAPPTGARDVQPDATDEGNPGGAGAGAVPAPPTQLPLAPAAPTTTSTTPATTRLRVLVRSAARVLLVGIGADEQAGGYARHRSVFVGTRGDWGRLQAELAVDTARLWSRNLGRDDRVCSAHAGREPRFPFLDEGVMALLRALPLPLVADPRLPHGVGDKRLLRVAGRLAGLTGSTTLVKRAIHFGSRIAKQANVAHFGSNRAARGDAAFAAPAAPAPAGAGSACAPLTD